MSVFREQPYPIHRDDRAECEKYSSYLGTLIVDFNKRCGYCNDLHSYRIRSFAIDHFVPRNPKDFIHPIAPNFYKNLVYSCNYCNGAKSNKFPTRNHELHNENNIGFVFPTDEKYNDLFYREDDGTIMPEDENPLAIYIIDELNLNNPIHSLMWRFEKLINLAKIIRQKVDETKDPDLINLKNELLEEYFEITQNIFENND